MPCEDWSMPRGGKLKHGHFEGGKPSSTYVSWRNMKQRCLDSNCTGFPNYGGKGVKVCDRWLVFENFLEDMGPKPEKGWHISRKGDVGDYSPENCQWKSPAENMRFSVKLNRGEKNISQS